MTKPSKDRDRALAAAKLIVDGRDPVTEMGAVLVTLEHLVAVVLLATMDRDQNKAAAMLNEGLVQGVEMRLALYASKQPR